MVTLVEDSISTKISAYNKNIKSLYTFKNDIFLKRALSGKQHNIDIILRTDDVYSHYILCHDFVDEIDFNNCSIVDKSKGTTEDLWNAIKNKDLSELELNEDDLTKLKIQNGIGKPIVDFDYYLEFLYEYRNFTMDSIDDLYKIQPDKHSIIEGILNIQVTKDKRNFMTVYPNKKRDFNIPNIDMHISGFNFPVLVQKLPKTLSNKIIKNDNNGECHAFVDESDKIVDIVRVNDFWLYNSPLGVRKSFFCRFDPVSDFLVCDTIDQVLEASRILDLDNELLVRSVLDPCISGKCAWYGWSADSLVTFKVHMYHNNTSKVLMLNDEPFFDYTIDVDKLGYDYVDISLDGSKVYIGEKTKHYMDIDDFNIFSKILRND